MSNILRAAGLLLYIGAGIWGLWIIVPLIYQRGGMYPAIVSLLFAPLTLLVVPWIIVITEGNWLLVILDYVPAILFGIFIIIADATDNRRRRSGFTPR